MGNLKKSTIILLAIFLLGKTSFATDEKFQNEFAQMEHYHQGSGEFGNDDGSTFSQAFSEDTVDYIDAEIFRANLSSLSYVNSIEIEGLTLSVKEWQEKILNYVRDRSKNLSPDQITSISRLSSELRNMPAKISVRLPSGSSIESEIKSFNSELADILINSASKTRAHRMAIADIIIVGTGLKASVQATTQFQQLGDRYTSTFTNMADRRMFQEIASRYSKN